MGINSLTIKMLFKLFLKPIKQNNRINKFEGKLSFILNCLYADASYSKIQKIN